MDDPLTIPKPAPSPSEPVPDEFDLLCEQCGYSLVGSMHTTICPECGTEFDPKQLPLARVPWLFRIRRGVFSAYVETVMLILGSPSAFAMELSRPVRISKTDAAQFRRATAWIAAASSSFPPVCAAILLGARRSPLFEPVAIWSVLIFLTIRLLAVFATDMPTFIWRGLSPDDPAELSPLQHYACAPLALVGLPAILIMFGLPSVLGVWFVYSPILTASLALGLLSAALLVLWLWCLPAVLMRVATRCSAGRTIALLLYLPFHWCIMGILSLALSALLTGATIMAVGFILHAVWAL